MKFSIKRPTTAMNLFLPSVHNANHLDEIENRFYSSIQLPNGTYKETCAHRLDDVNDITIQYLKNTNNECSRVLDVGVSSGITTLELYEFMKRNDFHPQITAMDLWIDGYILKLFFGIHALIDGRANILQIDLGGYGIGHWYKHPGNIKDLIKYYFDRFYTFLMKERIKTKIKTFDKNNKRICRIKLLTHRLLKNHAIEFFEYDLLNIFPGAHQKAYDYIRVANVLNLSNFPADDILLSLKNLKNCLRGTNAILCIVRTDHDGTNHGSIYFLNDRQKLQKSMSINNGSEIDSYVDQV